MMHFSKASLASSLLLAGNVLAIELNLEDASSIRDAAKTIAASVVNRYHNGSDIPGLFGEPYYFWESGLAWDSLIHYWHQTGDDSYNDIVGEALRFQVGGENDYMPTNQSKSEGNDDQSTWALAAMTAAEYGFPSDALKDLNTTWLDLAVAVFTSQAARWDEDSCKGGLRWQIFAFNAGYNYKNSMTNGNFYQLAYRLARFTGNETYEDWGARVRDWTFDVGLIGNVNSSDPGVVFDGTDSSNDCAQINRLVWTANAGTYLAGSAFAYNYTATLANSGYQSYVPVINATFASGLHGSTNGTITEVACARLNNCNTDQLAFRAVLARALAQTRALTDETPLWTYDDPVNISSPQNLSASQGSRTPAWSIHERIDFMLQTSAKGAAAQCSGGENGTTCGSDWASSEWDGTEGLGQDLSALNIILANIPITGELATVNSSAAEAGGSSGTVGDANGTTSGAGGENGTSGDVAPASEGAASSFAVSTMGLAVAVGGMMMMFL